ncbi:acyl-CoA desaturase [Tetranychus urticae]|uniref:Fatty acid desaturase domain-containing protein n=1 Tax=Tetranychus urticae TaxID=32264 RepID=T1KSI8_TETUR|nr:acyl-CoA desaturase [Tetranychus urticae]
MSEESECETQVEPQYLEKAVDEDFSQSKDYKMEIVWRNVILQGLLHSIIFWQIYYLYRYPDEWPNFWKLLKAGSLYTILFSSMGVTAGAHRLWSHKSYKAKVPLRVYLALAFASCGQDDILTWARDHRVHHKYSETDADPHNASRGFFFSHQGWLLVKKHPAVKEKGKNVDLSDLYADPVVMWQRKYYFWLAMLTIVVIPVAFPYYYWNIPFWHCFMASGVRLLLVLHGTWLVNSAAHLWGTKPYDNTIGPVEQNFWKIWVFTGEFYHNFHHTFPQDYKASEWGWIGQLNSAAMFIELMAMIGQAYDLKTTPRKIVLARKSRTGQWFSDKKNKTSQQSEVKVD